MEFNSGFKGLNRTVTTWRLQWTYNIRKDPVCTTQRTQYASI